VPLLECLNRRTSSDLLCGCVTGRCALFTQ
jgi:hypothetical protein